MKSAVLKKAMVTAVATASIGAGLAVASPGIASAAPCGFYTDAGRHWYDHCGPTNVRIRMHWDNFLAPDVEEEMCVGPGKTQIGTPNSLKRITGAWYVGLC
ncbi:DUF6355 family natural product biosynthesis protein [Rhodococcus sp. TAF43]|uniref:DUF6355 family natural product biosynthesis protein n=1 Tax=Rhodococcus sp. TAF43 TaxID=3237483 RepID=UPI003F9478F9